MSPERRRWLSLLRAVRRAQVATGTRVLERMATYDSVALTLDQHGQVEALVDLCADAAGRCDRLIAALSDEA